MEECSTKRGKKILFMEARENLFGHRRQNQSIVRVLSELGDLSIVFPEGWISNIPDGVKTYTFEPKKYHIKENAAQILKSLECMNYARKLDKEDNFDCIIFASYNVYAMGVVRLLFKNADKRVYIIHHNIIDQLEVSSVKRIIFNCFKNSTNHILIERFIAEQFAKATTISVDRIFYFSHQLNKIEYALNEDIDYLGISNSNDENWVKKMVEDEIENEWLKKEKIRMILRSTETVFDDGFLTVITGRLSDSEYYDYVLRSKVILVPFPKDFRYRVSGSVVDAFSNRKRVIGSDIPVIKEYSKLYPRICKSGISAQDLLKDHKNHENNKVKESKEFSEFIRSHSFDVMLEDFSHIISGISNLNDVTCEC